MAQRRSRLKSSYQVDADNRVVPVTVVSRALSVVQDQDPTRWLQRAPSPLRNKDPGQVEQGPSPVISEGRRRCRAPSSSSCASTAVSTTASARNHCRHQELPR